MDLVETLLPGVGIRYELTTRGGRHLGIVVRREGEVEISVYSDGDPDRAEGFVALAPDEAAALADVLGARVTERFADLSREVPVSPADGVPGRRSSPGASSRSSSPGWRSPRDRATSDPSPPRTCSCWPSRDRS